MFSLPFAPDQPLVEETGGLAGNGGSVYTGAAVGRVPTHSAACGRTKKTWARTLQKVIVSWYDPQVPACVHLFHPAGTINRKPPAMHKGVQKKKNGHKKSDQTRTLTGRGREAEREVGERGREEGGRTQDIKSS